MNKTELVEKIAVGAELSWMTIFFCLQKKMEWERLCKMWA